jgi:hypothetical protein
MMNKIFRISLVIFYLAFFIVLLGCGGGGYRDEALLGQAKRSLNRIKNSLEQYWVENGSYPPEGANLESYLGIYIEDWNEFVLESFAADPVYLTPDSLTVYLVEVKAKDRMETPFTIRNQREPIEEEESEDKKGKK